VPRPASKPDDGFFSAIANAGASGRREEMPDRPEPSQLLVDQRDEPDPPRNVSGQVESRQRYEHVVRHGGSHLLPPTARSLPCRRRVYGVAAAPWHCRAHRQGAIFGYDSVTLAEKQRHLAEDLAVIDDPQERLAFVVDRAKKVPPLPTAERTDDHRVRGCVSVVYLAGTLDAEGRCQFRCDADSPLVRGLVALLCDFFSGATPVEIAASDADPLGALGLTKNLTPTRQNGLASTRAAIRAFATANLA
jgi:cysteine desulfuration protein SufE